MAMPLAPENIVDCQDCGNPMDISQVAPFTKVECPTCGKQVRVKYEFGPYTLIRRHAVGGMSMVFVARDKTLNREVALKILSEDYSANEKRIAAFEEEARITASFSHPHVVRVFTTGKAFGRLYIAMELVPGGHFEARIQELGKVSEAEILPLAIEVAQGLKAAHSAGLIHRDVKPGNILLDSEGHAKLVDFGLALVTKGGKAQATEIWATPYYVPPETIEGYAEDLRSDIYAFGATLYHALAGVPSCGEETMATDILREAKQKVIPLGTREPQLSIDTCRIVDKAMAYDPANRFQNYDELISRLESALKRVLTGVANESSETVEKRRVETKRATLATSIAVGTVLTAAIAGGILWVTQQEEIEEKPRMVEGATVPTQDTGNPSDEATAIARSYREARSAVEAGDFSKAAEGFAALLTNPNVQEPTRTWSGIEAVVVAYIDGQPELARLHAFELAQHLRNQEHSSTRPPEALGVILDQLEKLPAIPETSLAEVGDDAVGVMCRFLVSLKNWEQGMKGENYLHFNDVVSADVPQNSQWISIYQKIAENYSTDEKLLDSPVFHDLPGDTEACEKAVDELEEILGKLKTRGRAQFNVKSFQQDIAKHAMKLAKRDETEDAAEAQNVPDENQAVSIEQVMASVQEFVQDCRFAEAAAFLSSLGEGVDAANRESLLHVTKSADELLKDLSKDLAAGSVSGDFSLRTGTALRSIASSTNGKLEAVDVTGTKRTIEWKDLTPETVILLHRTLVKNPMTEAQRLKRHERAICYEWLAGNRERAISAANLLAQNNPGFRETWNTIWGGLP